jgi:tRNA dimethylallyltransferase
LEQPPLLLAVMGPTASGKTALAEELATKMDALLLNADAFQVYRGMDVGTAKPADKERYQLVDIKDPNEAFGLGEWLRLAESVLNQAFEHSRSVIVVGGTGLYIRGLMESYAGIWPAPDPALRQELMDREQSEGLPALSLQLQSLAPEVAAKTDLANPARVRRALERIISGTTPDAVRLPPFRSLKIALDLELEKLYEQISRRAALMVQNGWLAEVENLASQGFGPGDPGFRALGYEDLWRHLNGEISLDAALQNATLATRRYGKRQRTWLRSEPRLKVFQAESATTALIWNWIHDSRGVD